MSCLSCFAVLCDQDRAEYIFDIYKFQKIPHKARQSKTRCHLGPAKGLTDFENDCYGIHIIGISQVGVHVSTGKTGETHIGPGREPKQNN